MNRLAWSLIATLALVTSFGLQPAPATAMPDTQPPSQLRVVHALPGTGPVSVLIDGVVAVPGLAFGQNPPYVPVVPGTHSVELVLEGVAPGAPLVTSPVVVTPGLTYTVFAIGAPPAPPALVVFPDEPIGAIGGAAGARFVHASPNVPPVDLAVSGGGPVLFTNIAFGQASPYIPVVPGTVDLEARAAGTADVVLDIPAVVLDAGRVYTFAALGVVGGTPPLGFLSLSDL